MISLHRNLFTILLLVQNIIEHSMVHCSTIGSFDTTTTTISPHIDGNLTDLPELAVSFNSSNSRMDSSEYILLDEYEYFEDDLTNSSYISEIEFSPDCSSSSILSKLQSIHFENRELPVNKHVPHLNNTMQVIDHLVNLTSTLIRTELTQERIGTIMEFFYTANVSDRCFLALAQVAKGIFEQQIWALKFVDATGKIPTGIAEGSIAHFGEFDECIEIADEEAANSEITGVGIRGQYCLAKFILPYPSIQSYRPNMPLFGSHHYRYMVDFLRVYNLDNYFTLPKFIELLNNQKGATLRLGVCFPSACSPQEFEGLLNQIMYPITKMPVELQPDCFNPEVEHRFDKFELTSIIVILLIVFVNIFCTIMDGILQSNVEQSGNDGNNNIKNETSTMSKSLKEAVKCFSMIHNIKALFDLNTNHCTQEHGYCCQMVEKICSQCCSQCNRPRPIRDGTGIRRFVFLDAIRLILVINVCIDHMFLFTPFMSFMAFKRILNSVITKVYYYNKYFFARNILIIDTLFIISGLVLSYSLLRKLTLSHGKMHYGVFLIRLWLKYSLPMAVVILLYWILPLTGDGPIWNVGMHLVVPACKDSFSLLSSFTYFSNYRIKATQNVFNFDPQFTVCNPPTWFLSALFQLQILGPLFVYIIYRNAKYGLLINGALVIVGCYTSISPNHLFGQKTIFDGLNISSLEEMVKAFVAFHMGINQYIISFFIGIIVGYLISHQLIYQRFNFTKRTEVVLWVVSVTALSAVMFWFNTLHRINQPAPRMSILLWFSVGKLIACVAIGWMLYALCVGRAVLVEQIFSLSFFRIMSRLSFGIYLLHFIPLTHRLFTVRDTYVMTDKLLFEYIVVDFIQTTFMAMIFHITVERPLNSIVSLLFSRNEFEDIFGKSSAPSNASESMDNSTVSSTPPPNPGVIITASTTTISATGCNTTGCPTINHHQIKCSLPSVNLFAANCHEVYLVSKKI